MGEVPTDPRERMEVERLHDGVYMRRTCWKSDPELSVLVEAVSWVNSLELKFGAYIDFPLVPRVDFGYLSIS